jgi:hypothetical protein
MKNGNNEHDFDSIADHLRHQDAVLEVLLHHLANVEATVTALTLKSLSDKNSYAVKRLKEYMQPKIYGKMIAGILRNLDDR